MNAPLPEGSEKQVYDVLEYWFCGEYTQHDRRFHVTPCNTEVNKTNQSIEAHDQEKQLDDTGYVKKTDDTNNDKLKRDLNLPQPSADPSDPQATA